MTRSLLVVAFSTFLAACHSTESRWAAYCAEAQASDDNVSVAAREPCKYGNQLTPDEKRALLDAHDRLKAAEAQLAATNEEGRRKGYIH